jgi:DNA-binding transcriptional regulator YiaG
MQKIFGSMNQKIEVNMSYFENAKMEPLNTTLKTLGLSTLLLAAALGTGSVYDIRHADTWIHSIKHRVPFSINKNEALIENTKLQSSPDIRSPAQHLENIRSIFNIPVSNIADLLNVSRQAVYKWLSENSSPEQEKQHIITTLSQTADKFHESNVLRPDTLLTMKAFNGQSLMDIIFSGKDPGQHITILIREAKIMQESYENSGLSLSKAKPTNNWQSYISIPGSFEND